MQNQQDEPSSQIKYSENAPTLWQVGQSINNHQFKEGHATDSAASQYETKLVM